MCKYRTTHYTNSNNTKKFCLKGLPSTGKTFTKFSYLFNYFLFIFLIEVISESSSLSNNEILAHLVITLSAWYLRLEIVKFRIRRKWSNVLMLKRDHDITLENDQCVFFALLFKGKFTSTLLTVLFVYANALISIKLAN